MGNDTSDHTLPEQRGTSAHAGVPAPNLPPLPPYVRPAGLPPAVDASAELSAPATAVETPAGAVASLAEPQPEPEPEADRADEPALVPAFVHAIRERFADADLNPRLLIVPVVLVVALVGLWMTRGTTSAENLRPGDCFMMPESAGDFSRLDTEPCDMPHDGQIIADVELSGPTTYPEDTDAYWQDVFTACAQKADEVLVRTDELPADTELNFFSPSADGWEQMGDRVSLCYLHAPGGITGSFLG